MPCCRSSDFINKCLCISFLRAVNFTSINPQSSKACPCDRARPIGCSPWYADPQLLTLRWLYQGWIQSWRASTTLFAYKAMEIGSRTVPLLPFLSWLTILVWYPQRQLLFITPNGNPAYSGRHKRLFSAPNMTYRGLQTQLSTYMHQW